MGCASNQFVGWDPIAWAELLAAGSAQQTNRASKERGPRDALPLTLID
jgi:hypothetical protein